MIIAIVGPTSTGKTALGIAVSKRLRGEVISADSRQVYRGLDLGSGKVTPSEAEGVPHHLIDVADPMTQFTVHDFVNHGREAIADIVSRGKVPIVVGGTGMYVDALLGRLTLDAPQADPEIRARLSTMTLEDLQSELQEVAPEKFQTIDVKNPRRVQRAIEIALSMPKVSPPREVTPFAYDVTWIGLTQPIETLKERIEIRARGRVAAGLVEEGKRLVRQGVTLGRLDALGLDYRALARHLAGTTTEDEMVAEIILENVKYARRQMTWFKRNTDIVWLDATRPAPALAEEYFSS